MAMWWSRQLLICCSFGDKGKNYFLATGPRYPINALLETASELPRHYVTVCVPRPQDQVGKTSLEKESASYRNVGSMCLSKGLKCAITGSDQTFTPQD
jgi:hypothetical protein